MINGKKVLVVMPAFHAAKTLAQTIAALPPNVVDDILVVDDASTDETSRVARELGVRVVVHPKNRGYGGNQKTCYAQALASDADIVVMVHPDYQYEPKLVTPICAMITSGVYDVVLGSRILGGQARAGGMPLWKYVANRALTFAENVLLGAKLSEYHTGYRAYSRAALEKIPFEHFSDDFVFDNQFLVKAILLKLRIGEVSCPTKYFPDASSINFRRSVRYGLGVMACAVAGAAKRAGFYTAAFLRDPRS